MNDDLNGKIIIFDDKQSMIIDGYKKLTKAFPKAQVLWSLTPDRRPRGGVPPKGKEINDPSWNYPLVPEDLCDSDAIILDLEMDFADKSATDPDQSYKSTFGPYQGFYVLEQAEKNGCLSKIFVNSAVIDLLRINKPELAQKLEQLVESELISVYRKDGNGPQFLIERIHSILDLKKRGYLCSTKTRNKLFLIGSAEGLSMEPVLIVGKTGTGKESAAWHIHEIGQRLRQRSSQALPLMVVHCGGLTPELARDELFGHARGAFTGANGYKLGSVLRSIGIHEGPARADDMRDWLLDDNEDRLERIPGEGAMNLRVATSAPYGTIFLDEFGELELSVQALLLRFLNSGEIQPLGYEGTISLKDSEDQLHVRFIGATNSSDVTDLLNADDSPSPQSESTKDLTQTLERSEIRFRDHSSVREDLIFRIARWVIELPELRADEVEDLIHLEQMRRIDLQEVVWEPEAISKLQSLVKSGAVPGQRRQLRTIAMRAMAFAKGATALGMNIYTKESPAVTLNILQEAIQPVTIQTEAVARFSRLHQAICQLLRSEGVWPTCREGFKWKDLHAVNRIDLCRMFLRSMLFVEEGRSPYQFDEIEIAWGVDRDKVGAARKSLEKYRIEAFKKELKDSPSKGSLPVRISYTNLRAELRKLKGDIYI